MNRFNSYTTLKSSVILLGCALFFILLSSCHKKKAAPKIDAIEDRAQIAGLDEYNVTTVISDSGITRYRISAPHWQIFDKAIEPYWLFPDGLHLENFDQNLNIDASVDAKFARFNQDKQIWELDKDIVAVNLKGERFETQQLFWDQKAEKIYSDSFITITQATSVITGYGFESDQTMTRYVIRNPQGIFPIRDNPTEVATNQEDNNTQL